MTFDALDSVRIQRLDLRPTLILAFVLVAVLVAVTGAVGYVGVADIDREAHLIAEDGQKMDAAAELVVATKTQQAAVQAARLGQSDARQEFQGGLEHFSEESTRLENSRLTAEQAELLSTIQSQHAAYTQLGEEFFEARAAGNAELASQKAAEMRRLEAG